MAVTPESATTSSVTRRHLSANLTSEPLVPGREGVALCSGMAVYDQTYVDYVHRLNSGWRHHNRMGAVIADLPPCKPCERAAAKLTGES